MTHDIEETCSNSSFEDIESRAATVGDEEVASVVVSDSEDTQVTRAPRDSDAQLEAIKAETKAEAVTATEPWKKDETFFFTLVIFRVGDRLFRVPRDAFENQSEYFRNLLAAQERSEASGDIKKPVFLEGVEKDAFRDFLCLLYPPPRTSSFTGPILLTREQWIKVLDLAQRWQFAGIRSLAIQELQSIKLDEVEKLELALKYGIRQWYADAYLALAKRPQPLTIEEGRRLGLDLSLKMAQIRERKLARMMESKAASTTQASTKTISQVSDSSIRTLSPKIPASATSSSTEATQESYKRASTEASFVASLRLASSAKAKDASKPAASGATAFAPFAGAYLPFGSATGQVGQSASASSGTGAPLFQATQTAKPRKYVVNLPATSVPSPPMQSVPASTAAQSLPTAIVSLPPPEFGKAGFGYMTTTTTGNCMHSKDSGSSAANPESARKCPMCQSDKGASTAKLNGDYDDVQLKKDIKEAFGL